MAGNFTKPLGGHLVVLPCPQHACHIPLSFKRADTVDMFSNAKGRVGGIAVQLLNTTGAI
jgi:hypothetical protein